MCLTEATRNFIRKEHFDKAKKEMVIINIGRGALIDELCLEEALRTKVIHGAALDVFLEVSIGSYKLSLID